MVEAAAEAGLISDLYKQIKELRSSATAKEKDTVDAVGHLLERVQRSTADLILRYPDYSTAPQTDAHGKLWLNVYYKQIESYRKSILKRADEVKKQAAGVAEGAEAVDEQLVFKTKHNFVRLVAAYTKFLTDAMAFFQDLMLSLEAAATQQEHDATTAKSLVKSISKCLVSLGDLARYKESLNEGSNKNYEVAFRYYERSAFFAPTVGTPQNGMAVLATYEKSDLVAVYHYCRSVLVSHPFSQGYANLSTLFGKNEKAYQNVLREMQRDNEASVLVPTSGSVATLRRLPGGGTVGKQDQKIKVHFFILQFIRLHASIFDWCACRFGLLGDVPKAPPQINIEDFTSDVHDMLSHLDEVVTSLSDALLVRLIVICIYSIHESIPVPTRGEHEEKTVSRNRGPRTTGESLALIIIYGLVNKISTQLLGDKKKALRKMLLAPFAVFAEWSSLYNEYLMSSGASLSGQGASDPTLYASPDLVRIEGRARSSMRSAINLLDKNDYFDLPSNVSLSSRSDNKVLPEYIRLRGFLPLCNQYEQFFQSPSSPMPKAPVVYPDDDARDLRLRILKAFVRDWLVPCAQREAVEGEERRRESEAANKRELEQQQQHDVSSPRGGVGMGGEKKIWVPPGSGNNKDRSSTKQRAVVAGDSEKKRPKDEKRQNSSPPVGKRSRSQDANITNNKSTSAGAARSSGPFASSALYSSVPPESVNPFEDELRNQGGGFQYDVDDGGELDEGGESKDEQKSAGSPRHVFQQPQARPISAVAAAKDDDDDVDDIVVFRPNFSRTFTTSPGLDRGSGLQPTLSLASMMSCSSTNSGCAEIDDCDDEDATLLLASASLGDWLGMTALGTLDPAKDNPAVPPSTSSVFGSLNFADGTWNSSLGLLLPRDSLTTAPLPTASGPPPGFSSGAPATAARPSFPPGFGDGPPAPAPFSANPFFAAKR